MRLLPGSSTQALGVTLDGWIGARPLFGAHVSARAAQRAVAVAIVPMVALTVWLALASEHLVRPVASALYWSERVAVPPRPNVSRSSRRCCLRPRNIVLLP